MAGPQPRCRRWSALKDFENVYKKLETTAFKNFKTIANMELKEFLEK